MTRPTDAAIAKTIDAVETDVRLTGAGFMMVTLEPDGMFVLERLPPAAVSINLAALHGSPSAPT